MRSAVAMNVRDDSAQRAKGVRLLLVSEPSALPRWDGADAVAIQPHLTGADFLVVDGYSFRAEPRRSATLAVMDSARRMGVRVVCDVVPHTCFRDVGLDEVRRYVAPASIIVVEARTLNTLAGEAWTGGDADEPAAQRAVTTAMRVFPGRHVFIRYGFGNSDRTMVLSPDQGIDVYRTGYAKDDEPRGFGDRLLAAELHRLASVNLGPGEPEELRVRIGDDRLVDAVQHDVGGSIDAVTARVGEPADEAGHGRREPD
jgi:hypothetical protein